MEDRFQVIADRKWQEMILALQNEGADVAFDVFAEALQEVANLISAK